MTEQQHEKLANHILAYAKEMQAQEELGIPQTLGEPFQGELFKIIGGRLGIEIQSEINEATIMDHIIDNYEEDYPERLFLFAKAFHEALTERLTKVTALAAASQQMIMEKLEGRNPIGKLREGRELSRVQQMINDWDNDGEEDEDD